jgi:DNA-binding LacI/PurR family transcriptional regulator
VVTDTRRSSPMPTLKDVAAVAGVSYQTVSRVLNEHPNVAAPTRELVLRAIAELGYEPDEAARALRARRPEKPRS